MNMINLLGCMNEYEGNSEDSANDDDLQTYRICYNDLTTLPQWRNKCCTQCSSGPTAGGEEKHIYK